VILFNMSRRDGIHVPAVRVANEKSLGITQRCTPINFAWTGDIRKRYASHFNLTSKRSAALLTLN
jgi:tRNA pseudouridine13 synthase